MAEEFKRKSYKDYILMTVVVILFLCLLGAVYFCAVNNKWFVEEYKIEIMSTHGKITASKKSAKKGDTILVQCEPDNGYEFKHFLINDKVLKENSFIMPNEDVVLKADFNLIEYDINYVLNDMIVTNENLTTYTVETPTFELSAPISDIAIFEGWFKDDLFTNQVTKIEKGSFGDLTLYPKILEYEFESGRISSSEKIKTEHFTVNISSKTYIPPYFEENLEKLYFAIQKVSRLNFKNSLFNERGHINIDVLPATNESSGNECGNSHTRAFEKKIILGKADLLMGNTYILANHLSSLIQSSQSFWVFPTAISGGFAQYNCFKLIEYLQKTDISLAKTLTKSSKMLSDDVVWLPEFIYNQSVEYWIENGTGDYEKFNGSFGVGLEFMHYLDDVYGDYTSWIVEYEKANPSDSTTDIIQNVGFEETFELFKSVYGDDVFDNFYPYLKENAFFIQIEDIIRNKHDLTELDKTYLYPFFYYSGNYIKIENFSYNNLIVDLTETKKYLSEYKNRNASNLVLKLSEPVSLTLLYNDNTVKRVTTSQISISEVKYFCLNGSESLNSLNVQY